MTLKDELKQYIELIDHQLHYYFNIKKDLNHTIVEGMKYSIFAGGKRLRPVLALASYDIFGDDKHEILPYACAIEMIHTYSLIHDDLPAMDNDDYRRGKLTNHKVFGEGPAILAGDSLLNYAFEIMLTDACRKDNPLTQVKAMKAIADGAGIHGMIGGQIVDLESEHKQVDSEILNYIHHNKTAALIAVPLKVGAIIGRASDNDIKRMNEVGINLGLAFQIQDDILDIIGDKEKLGKNTGSDAQNAKATYPSLYGLENSKEKVRELTGKVSELLQHYGEKATFLLGLSHYLMSREY